jgi:hypothetical protein
VSAARRTVCWPLLAATFLEHQKTGTLDLVSLDGVRASAAFRADKPVERAPAVPAP